jgi:hypothetical protein
MDTDPRLHTPLTFSQQPAQYAPGRSPLPQAPPGYQYVATGQTPPPMQQPQWSRAM